tara:strand:+ start:309 stop:1205 length:897 start_codon:yes stop_codon:yes gene_type:complete
LRGLSFVVDLNVTKKLLFCLFIIIFVFLVTRNGCDNSFAGFLGVRSVTIDTWEEWQEQLLGVDHFEKYGAISVGFDEESIRSDFVKIFDEEFSSRVFDNVFGIFSNTDSLFSMVRRNRDIAVWRDGKILHISDHLSYTLSLTNDYFNEWIESTEWMLDSTIDKHIDGRIDDATYLLFSTISSLFNKLVLHGKNDKIIELELPYYFGENRDDLNETNSAIEKNNRSGWTEKNKQAFIDGCKENKPINNMNQNETNEFCDCVLEKLIDNVPDPEIYEGDLPESIVREIQLECYKILKLNI